MKTHQQKATVTRLDTAKRGTERARLPIRTANIPVPQAADTPRKARPRTDRGATAAAEANEPFEFSELTEQARAMADANDRHWPRLPGFLNDRENEAVSAIDDLRQELSARCIQIADLHNIQQQQSAALMVARTAIESLEASVTAQQKTITQRESEAAAAKQALLYATQEKNALSEKLKDMERETTELLQKVLHLSTALNDKEVAIVSAEERATALEQALTATIAHDKAEQNKTAQDAAIQNATAQDNAAQNQTAQDATIQDATAQDKAAPEPAPAPAPAPAQVIAEDQKPASDERAERSIQFESLLERIERMLAANGEQANKLDEANTKLTERCDTLDGSFTQLESQNKSLETKIKKIEGTLATHGGQIDTLSVVSVRLSERCDKLEKPHPQVEIQIKNLEKQIKKIDGAIVARDEHIDELKETNTTLSERCDELTHNNIILESGHKHAQEKLKTQLSDIKLLEAALRTGRITAERRTAERTDDMQRERKEQSAAEREAAAIRKEIAYLLSKLAITVPPSFQ